MGIDIFNIKPHQVSRNLRGYSVFFYGGWKTGKTTIASKFPKALLLAAEKGYNALAGVMAQPINSWAEFKKVLRQLQEDQAKAMFETIVLDTADIFYDYCTKYVCDNYPRPDGGFGVDSIADIRYGRGYGLVEKEFDTALRSIVQMDYGLVIISHSTDKTFTDENGNQYNKIVPTLDKRANNICARMCDIVGYSREVLDKDNNLSIKLFMRGTPRYEAGSRFRFTPNYIDFTYDNLVKAISDAIDKQAEEDGKQFFTNNKENSYQDTSQNLDFDVLFEECNNIIKELIEKYSDEQFKNFFQPRIIQITDKYLGRGQKLSQCSREQIEALSLISDDLKELAKKTPK